MGENFIPVPKVELMDANAFVPSQQTSNMLAPSTGTVWDSIIQYNQGNKRLEAEQAVADQAASDKAGAEEKASTLEERKRAAYVAVLGRTSGLTPEQASNQYDSGLKVQAKTVGTYGKGSFFDDKDGNTYNVITDKDGKSKKIYVGKTSELEQGGGGGSGGKGTKTEESFLNTPTKQSGVSSEVAKQYDVKMVQDPTTGITTMRFANPNDRVEALKITSGATALANSTSADYGNTGNRSEAIRLSRLVVLGKISTTQAKEKYREGLARTHAGFLPDENVPSVYNNTDLYSEYTPPFNPVEDSVKATQEALASTPQSTSTPSPQESIDNIPEKSWTKLKKHREDGIFKVGGKTLVVRNGMIAEMK